MRLPKTEVDKVLIDNDDLYVRYVGTAKPPDGYSEGVLRHKVWNQYLHLGLDNSEKFRMG